MILIQHKAYSPRQTTIGEKGSGVKMKPSGIGGMAVMEGVMMRNKEEYAVAVRKPNNEIAVEKSVHKDFSDKVKLFKLPIFRGMLAFVDSMVVGVKVLNFSASFFEEEEEDKDKKNKKGKKEKKTESIDSDFEIVEVLEPLKSSTEKKIDTNNTESALMIFFAVLLSIVLSVALFMVLPVFITQLISHYVKSTLLINLIEGLVRLGIFIGYVILAALMPEIKRTFMYHGAEHKTINCLERGYELTVANVRKQSKQHKRCGTSFMLLVILISLVFFMLIPSGGILWRTLTRVLLVPFIAGVSYEFIRLAGKSESKLVDALSKPGLWMQGLTTREPDDSMIEVAIQSVDAVFDWKAFLAESKSGNSKQAPTSNQKSGQTSSGKQSNADKQKASVKQAGKEKQADTGRQEKQSEAEKKPDNRKKTTEKQSTSGKQAGNQKHNDSTKQNNQSNAAKQTGSVGRDNSVSNNALHNEKITPSQKKSPEDEEEDDEILKALDKYFDNQEEQASGGK